MKYRQQIIPYDPKIKLGDEVTIEPLFSLPKRVVLSFLLDGDDLTDLPNNIAYMKAPNGKILYGNLSH